MPYTERERKLYRALLKQYGTRKGKQVYHAMANKARRTKRSNIFGWRTTAVKS